MEKTFTLDQSNALLQGGELYDLHNCYTFKSIVITADRKALLTFEPEAQWTTQGAVVVEFHDVDYLLLSNGFGTRLADLDEMGYLQPTEVYDQSLAAERYADDSYHFVFSFFGVDYIRIHSARATLRLVDESG